MAWARYPSVVEPASRAACRSAASTSASAAFSQKPEDLAFEAALCLRSEENQIVATAEGRPAAHDSRGSTTDQRVKEAYPVRRRCCARPIARRRPAPGHARLQRHLAGHPADAPPAQGHRAAEQTIEELADSSRRSRREGSSDGDAAPAGAGAGHRDAAAPKALTDRARAERRLGWMLCAPAVIVMLLVTGYPIVYAICLSLQRYDLRFPDEQRVRRARATTSRS